MKSIKLLFLIITAALAFQACRVNKPITSEMKLTEVYVESGNINPSTLNFSSNGHFNSSHSVIGLIDSTADCVNSNGYMAKDNYVYVFEGGAIPNKIIKMGPFLRYLFFKKARWTNNYNYNLPFDAEICKDEPNKHYYFRLAGNTLRQEATIRGEKVYRFKEDIVEENYTEILNTMKFLKDRKSPINYHSLLRLNPSVFKMESTRPGLIVNTDSGTIDLSNSSETPLGSVDKILFKSNNPRIKSFRFRTIYKQLNPQIQNRYFDQNGDVIDFSAWLSYLQGNVFLKYNEKTVKGYTCLKCSHNNPSIRGEDSNPPPGMMP
ncbi:hypothetical protein [Arcticibacterium luteifluviistationis]|uniref:DUF4249 domain-containing protein n=1 Tax=Arcticibacterium luteifluviistationis TaxID=1784714 RepID=A0A2Z4GGG3_9BACT|nr:hypothetical protein [Arcticibacterium luteifluviistationis]AWW00483.1 hypothetical protein DJ013_20790 [Arcticibacterium luteifluviistationis]